MDILCPSCEKRLLLRLHAESYCNSWCGNCGSEIPPESLLEAGVPKSLVEKLIPWGRSVQDLLNIEDEAGVGGDRSDADYVKAWKALRDGTEEIMNAFRTFLPTGTAAFGPAKPPHWSDEEILRWRRQRERESLLFNYGYQEGARFVSQGGVPMTEGEKLPVEFPGACITTSEKKRYQNGFLLGTQMGDFDETLFAEIEESLHRRYSS